MGRTPPDHPRTFEGVRAICFDLDNTLIDIIHLKRRAAEAAGWALADAGMDVNPEKAARAIHELALNFGIDREDIVDHYIAHKLGHPDPRLVAIARHAYERAEDQHATPYPRAHGTLLELTRRGYALVLVTDAPRHRAVRRLQAARLTPFFRHLITLEDTGSGKTTPRPYAIAAERLGLAPNELVMVGDNPRLDIGTARAHGCLTILAEYGLQGHFASDEPAHQPDHKVQWLDELLTLLPPRRPHENALSPPAQPGEAACGPGEVCA